MTTRALAIFAACFVATPAAAGVIHYETRPTQAEAMQAATAAARERAKRKDTCYKPAWTVNQCVAVPGGVTCRADSANHFGSCGGKGYLLGNKQPQMPTAFEIPVYPLPEWPNASSKSAAKAVPASRARQSWKFWE